MLYKLHDSCLYYDEDQIPIYVKGYYIYVVKLFMDFLINNENIRVNIQFSNQKPDVEPNVLKQWNQNTKTIKVGINFQHTLVTKGGVESTKEYVGNIPTLNNSGNYLVQIENFEQNMDCDIIVDYSIPNIVNVFESNLFNKYANKMIYVSPLLYKPNCEKRERTITCLTTFMDTDEPRRANLLSKLSEKKIKHLNVHDCFQKSQLNELYTDTKILINIHKTDNHHTFEELRVLPALSCGVVVIAEESPLKHTIPYHEHIIWTTIENIVEKTKEVMANYDYYWERIFGEGIAEDIAEMHYVNYSTISNKFISVIG